MDGFDADEGEGESDEGAVVLGCLLAPERHALEALELAHRLLDASAASGVGSREGLGPVPGMALEGNDRSGLNVSETCSARCATPSSSL